MSNPIISRMSVLMGIPPRPKINILPEAKLTLPTLPEIAKTEFPTINDIRVGSSIYCVTYVGDNKSYLKEYTIVSGIFCKTVADLDKQVIKVRDMTYEYNLDIDLEYCNIIRSSRNYNLNRAFYLKEDAEKYFNYFGKLTVQEIGEINNKELGQYDCKMTLAEELKSRQRSIDALKERIEDLETKIKETNFE